MTKMERAIGLPNVIHNRKCTIVSAVQTKIAIFPLYSPQFHATISFYVCNKLRTSTRQLHNKKYMTMMLMLVERIGDSLYERSTRC